MSGRIRSIKPEVLEDEKAAALSDAAWRLWVGSWALCDDHGNCRAGAKYLAARIWHDTRREKLADKALAELDRAGMVTVYSVGDQKYLHVRGWEKHQRVDNAGKHHVPPPPEKSTQEKHEDTSRFAESSADPKVSQTVSREIPLARRARAQSGGETSDHDHDHDHRPPTGPPTEPEPSVAPLALPGVSGTLESETKPTATKPSPIDEVYAHFVETKRKAKPGSRPAPKLVDPKLRRAVKLLLDAGRTVEDLKLACEGLFLSPHHLGENDRHTEYLDFEYVATKPKNIDAFVALAQERSGPPGHRATYRREVPTADELAKVDPVAVKASIAADLQALKRAHEAELFADVPEVQP